MTKKYPDTTTYKYHNENPKNRKTGDCVLRAISVALNKSWDEVLDDLVAISHATKYSPMSTECYSRYLENNGYIKQKQPRKFDNTKYTGEEFCKYISNTYPDRIGNVLAHIGGHHITVFSDADGQGLRCWDTWNPTEYTIGNFWIKL